MAKKKTSKQEEPKQKEPAGVADADGISVKMLRSVASPYPGSHNPGSVLPVPPAVAQSWCASGTAEPADEDAAGALDALKNTPSETK